MNKDAISAQYFNDRFLIKSPDSFSFSGRRFTSSHLARLTGAPDGARFSFQNGAGGVMIKATHEFYAGESVRKLSIDNEGYLILFNYQLHIKPAVEGGPGPGFGTRIFARQVAAARDFGIPTITTYAGAIKGEKSLVGYFVWPKLGFDADIPTELVPKLPESLSGCSRVRHLYNTIEGENWWKSQKHGCMMDFDVRESSPQSIHLANYLDAKGVSI